MEEDKYDLEQAITCESDSSSVSNVEDLISIISNIDGQQRLVEILGKVQN